MADLIERLRAFEGSDELGNGDFSLLTEAAAEIEALRAEVTEAREFRDKMANAIGNDQLRRFIEKHGEPVPLTTRMQAAEARAERLAEALRVAREYVVSELAAERDKFAGYEHCSNIASIEADLAKIDAALSASERR